MQYYRNKAEDFVAATIDLVTGKPLVVRLGNRSDRLNKRVEDEIAALELLLANVKAFGAAQATANAKLIDDAITAANTDELEAEGRRLDRERELRLAAANRIDSYKRAIRRVESQLRVAIAAADAKADDERQKASDAISAAEAAKARATAEAAKLSGQPENTDEPDSTEG
jgi:hypothetical protein